MLLLMNIMYKGTILQYSYDRYEYATHSCFSNLSTEVFFGNRTLC
jgi:hypothetical protein